MNCFDFQFVCFVKDKVDENKQLRSLILIKKINELMSQESFWKTKF
jgi:hypothetical protein